MKCFYHNDLDGRCAAAIVAYYTKNYTPSDYQEVDYAKNLPNISNCRDEDVFFVDYSFTESTYHILEELAVMGCYVVWIDHHTSSFKLCEAHKELGKIEGSRQDYGSGAYLTYEYFYHDTPPYFVRLVSDYDCWQYSMEPFTTLFKLGVETFPNDALDVCWKQLLQQGSEDMWARKEEQLILENGRVIKGYVDQQNTFYREHFCYESTIAGYRCLVVNWKTNSWVFGDLVKTYPITMVWVYDGCNYSYSIFSIDPSVDCSKIAESYGGGGHKGAAGFKSEELLFKRK